MYGPASGCGDFITQGVPPGCGDSAGLLALGAGNFIPFEAQGFMLLGLYSNASGREAADSNWVGEEGGYVLRLYAPTGALTHAPYHVQFLDAFGQTWPLAEPSCHSSMIGDGLDCYPRYANTILDFATPLCPQGIHRIKVTDSRGQQYVIPVTVRAVPTPWSREVDTIRARFDADVYAPYPEGGGS